MKFNDLNDTLFLDKEPLQQNGFSVNDTLKGYNPYPNYHYSGVLRPHPLVSKLLLYFYIIYM